MEGETEQAVQEFLEAHDTEWGSTFAASQWSECLVDQLTQREVEQVNP